MSKDYDLVVIGGGINGAGIARDAALRGLRVLLLEKNDFGSGTSSWSSRLIHGGLRYLEYAEIPLVYESLRERRLLQLIAPHLVRRLRLTIPVFESSRRSLWLVRLGMIAYDLLSITKSIPRHKMLSRDEVLAAVPALRRDGLKGGAQYYDAQIVYAERLVLENIISASEAGAVVKNYSPVIGLNVKDSRIQSVHYVDNETGNETEVSASIVVNAAGPWVDRVLDTLNRKMPRFMGGTKGSHIIVPTFPGAPTEALYAEAKADGRPFFIIPWNGQLLIGTTDIRFSGDPAEVTASADEIEYLRNETARLFPDSGLLEKPINFAYAGVRPLPFRESGPESAITRKHIIKKHRVLARGLISIIGGKLTTYRNLAEQTVDYVNRKIATQLRPCTTRSLPLPGAVAVENARDELQNMALLPPSAIDRLLSIYGGRAANIASIARSDGELAKPISDDGQVLAAEIMHTIDAELAKTLVDIVHRRTMLGLSSTQGAEYSEFIAEVAGQRFGWSLRERRQQLEDLATYNARLKGLHSDLNP